MFRSIRVAVDLERNADGSMACMTINWPEVLIGGVIFFVIGSLFTIFVQPSIERRLEKRRESTLRRREAADAEFRARVVELAGDPVLFTAVARAGFAEMFLHALRAAVWVVLSLGFGAMVPLVSALPLIGALLELVPIGRFVKTHYDTSRAVLEVLDGGPTSDTVPATDT